MRSKSLMFRTWELFTSWYAGIKKSFTTLKLTFVRRTPGYRQVLVTVTY